MTQPALEVIQKRHKELLNKSAEISEADISQVKAFLETLEQAGTYIGDSEDRSMLRALIRYWAGFVSEKTGEFPIAQLKPFDGFLAKERTERSLGEQEPAKGRNYRRTKQLSRKAIFLIIATTLVLAGAIGTASFLWFSRSQTSQPNCLSIGNFAPATSTPSPSLPKKIGSYSISQGAILTTISESWTIVEGDISYIDPDTKLPKTVKSVYCPNPDDPNVGGLLAVRGSVKIIGTNAASYDLYPGKATVQQIREILLQYEQDLYSHGCKGNGGCLFISVVIIDNGILLS